MATSEEVEDGPDRGKADGEELAKKKGRRHKKMTVPVAVVAPIALGTYRIAKLVAENNVNTAVKYATGVDSAGKFQWDPFMTTYAPIAAGFAIHWIAGKVGLNRMIGAAGVPIIRI